MLFCLDPGHRNTTFDFGATGFGIKESVLSLEIAQKLAKKMKENGHQVVFTREDENTVLSLESRVKKANQLPIDYFISIHINAYALEQSNGFEVFHYGNQEQLSVNICKEVCALTKQSNRGAKTSDFYVLRATKSKAILIECGFITNKKECDLLTKNDFQEKIVDGILKGFGIHQKEKPIEIKDDKKIEIIINGVNKSFIIDCQKSELEKIIQEGFILLPYSVFKTNVICKPIDK